MVKGPPGGISSCGQRTFLGTKRDTGEVPAAFTVTATAPAKRGGGREELWFTVHRARLMHRTRSSWTAETAANFSRISQCLAGWKYPENTASECINGSVGMKQGLGLRERQARRGLGKEEEAGQGGGAAGRQACLPACPAAQPPCPPSVSCGPCASQPPAGLPIGRAGLWETTPHLATAAAACAFRFSNGKAPTASTPREC